MCITKCVCGCEYFVWWMGAEATVYDSIGLNPFRYSSATPFAIYDKEKHPRACCKLCNRDVESMIVEIEDDLKIITVDSEVIKDIIKERKRQEVKWGEQNYEPFKWLSVLGEEFGEACKGVLEEDLDNYREELVHVAAVAVAAIASIDRTMIKQGAK